MAKTVVVFHSGYGHTERLAKVVAEGAGAALIAIDQNGDISDEARQALDEADAIIFGSPTYMGGPSRSSRNSRTPAPRPRSAASGRTKCSAALPTAPA